MSKVFQIWWCFEKDCIHLKKWVYQHKFLQLISWCRHVFNPQIVRTSLSSVLESQVLERLKTQRRWTFQSFSDDEKKFMCSVQVIQYLAYVAASKPKGSSHAPTSVSRPSRWKGPLWPQDDPRLSCFQLNFISNIANAHTREVLVILYLEGVPNALNSLWYPVSAF